MSLRHALAIFILGFIAGNLYAVWTEQDRLDPLDCIELPVCPGLDEAPTSQRAPGQRTIWL